MRRFCQASRAIPRRPIVASWMRRWRAGIAHPSRSGDLRQRCRPLSVSDIVRRVSLERHKEDWERLAEADPLWAVLTPPDGEGRRAGMPSASSQPARRRSPTSSSVAERLGPVARGRALDFGCGVGRLTRALGDAVRARPSASTSRRRWSRRRAASTPSVPALRVRGQRCARPRQFETASFDLVYSSIVLQHLPSARTSSGTWRSSSASRSPTASLVFQLPTHGAAPVRAPAQPPARYGLLRRLGVPERTILRRTPLTPMRMTAIAEEDVRAARRRRGAEVLAVRAARRGRVPLAPLLLSPSAP